MDKSANNQILGALEAGGTKMVCAIGAPDGTILDQISIPTEKPEITMPKMIDYFRSKNISALGIGSFGPIDLNRNSATYGYITTTPKPGWGNYDICGEFGKALNVPIGFDTDVNAAALGEAVYGAAKGLDSAIYITIGTGIGVGVLSEGKLLHGMLHPEAGHILIGKLKGDTFEGKCPFHKTCFEGMASGPAIEARWGQKGDKLAATDEVWELEAEYIAHALVNYTMTLSPKRIILGGGVMNQLQLFPLIRRRFGELLNGYIKTAELSDSDSFIVPAGLGGTQGIVGCLVLAAGAINE